MARGRLIARLSLLQAPVVDGFDVEAPVAAHMKCRNLMLLQQLVDRGWMHVQVCGYFAHGHHFDRPRIMRRLGSIFNFHLQSLSTRANPARLRIARSKKAKGRALDGSSLSESLAGRRQWPCLHARRVSRN